MNKLKELETTQDAVLDILTKIPETRSNDNLLLYHVYKKAGEKAGINIESMSMPRFLMNMKEYGFPSFETVRRTRQRLQAMHKELCANAEVEVFRNLNESEYKRYAVKAVD